MAQNIVFNGNAYVIPDTGEEDWGQNLTDFFVAIPQGALQKTGGVFTLTSEVNFGATFGLVSPYFKSRSANIANEGVLRLSVQDLVSWRNNANDANLVLGIDSSDNLTINGVPLLTSADFITELVGDVTASSPPGIATATITNGVVTNAKLAAMPALRIKGNSSGSPGSVQDLTTSQVTSILNPFDGDSGLGGVKGLVPAPTAGFGAEGRVLSASGSWEKTIPETTVFSTPGTDSYLVPTGARYLFVEVQGAGGGGGGGGSPAEPGGTGGTGGDSSISYSASPIVTCTGGQGGSWNGTGGTGGTASAVSPSTPILVIDGSRGNGYSQGSISGVPGVASYLGYGGPQSAGGGSAGGTAILGGGGGGGGNSSDGRCSSGGAGAYASAYIYSPEAAYDIEIGAGGSAGSAGNGSSGNGGSGGAGIVIITAYFL